MTPGSFPGLKVTLLALLDDEQRIGAKPTKLRHVAGRLGLECLFSATP